jgi:hypothetical protein
VRTPANDFGGATHPATVLQPGELSHHADGHLLKIKITHAKGDDLAPAQTREGGEQHQRPVAPLPCARVCYPSFSCVELKA